MVTTTATVASKVIPVIIKVAKIGLRLVPVTIAAEPYVRKAIHKKRNETSSHNKTRRVSRNA